MKCLAGLLMQLGGQQDLKLGIGAGGAGLLAKLRGASAVKIASMSISMEALTICLVPFMHAALGKLLSLSLDQLGTRDTLHWATHGSTCRSWNGTEMC